MAEQHTPGPWEDSGNSDCIKIQQKVTLETIAFLKPGYPGNEPNALLIAAAPEQQARIKELESKETIAGLLVDSQKAFIDRLKAEKAELVKVLARLDRIAALINHDHHQRLVTSNDDWSEVYSARVEARALLAKAETVETDTQTKG